MESKQMNAQSSTAGKTRRAPLRPTRLAWLAVTVTLLASEPRACGQADVKEAIEWFDTLGRPDLAKVEFVKVATGEFSAPKGRPPVKQFQPAFLLATEGESFKILTLGLKTEWYTTRRHGNEMTEVGYEPVDLKAAMAEYLKSLSKLEKDSPEIAQMFGHYVSDTERFVLARACERRGLADEARTLFRNVKSELLTRRIEKAESFRQDVIDHMAHGPLSEIIFAFEDPKVTRRELLARFEKFIKDYPGPEKFKDGEQPADNFSVGMFGVGYHQVTARSYVRVLKKMVAEDEERARRPLKPEAQMTRDERIADLIYQLRDQQEKPLSEWPAFESGPAAELIKIGFLAVPKLIAALDDRRLTRVLHHYGVNLGMGSQVVTVGFCAWRILSTLAGQEFIGEGSDDAIRAWWADIQKKGEKQALVDAVASGGPVIGRRAEMLVEEYPDAALNALAKGIADAKSDEVRSWLVRAVGNLKGDAATALLREQLNLPALSVRLAAARALAKRSVYDGVAPMIEVWRNSAAKSPEDEYDLDEVIRFLAGCGRPEAIKALGVGLLERNKIQQANAIEALRYYVQDGKTPPPPAVASARDEVLVSELSNTERSGTAGNWSEDESQVNYPRFCDLAAFHLAELWKLKPPFRFHSPLLTRERYRIDLINIWRERQGQPPLPVPAPRTVKRLPDALVNPKLDALLAAANDRERVRAIRAVEELGLPALPAVRELLASMAEDNPAHAELKKAASRLACIVTAVEVSRSSARPDDSTRKLLASLKGRPLNVAGLAEFALKYTKDLPAGVVGLALAIDREGDDSGITLTFSLVKGDYDRRHFNTAESVEVDGQSIYGSGSSGVTPDLRDELNKKLQRAFELGPEKQVSGRASIVSLRARRDD
jgi:hypothetical protein